jgi:hypothetical protein
VDDEDNVGVGAAEKLTRAENPAPLVGVVDRLGHNQHDRIDRLRASSTGVGRHRIRLGA